MLEMLGWKSQLIKLLDFIFEKRKSLTKVEQLTEVPGPAQTLLALPRQSTKKSCDSPFEYKFVFRGWMSVGFTLQQLSSEPHIWGQLTDMKNLI
jgi:hypothetical protein